MKQLKTGGGASYLALQTSFTIQYNQDFWQGPTCPKGQSTKMDKSPGNDQVHPWTLWEAREKIAQAFAEILYLHIPETQVRFQKTAGCLMLYCYLRRAARTIQGTTGWLAWHLWWVNCWRGFFGTGTTNICVHKDWWGWLIMALYKRNHASQICWRFLSNFCQTLTGKNNYMLEYLWWIFLQLQISLIGTYWITCKSTVQHRCLPLEGTSQKHLILYCMITESLQIF